MDKRSKVASSSSKVMGSYVRWFYVGEGRALLGWGDVT